MNISSFATKYKHNEAALIVSAAFLMVVGLVAFEYVTGLPASLRGDPMYNAMPAIESTHQAADESEEEERIPSVGDLLMDRVCERVVRRFANDESTWARVNERLLKRLGFSCEK